ncbi:hypothetical protein ACFXNW_09070 [Nocardia sp. NPDC059180]|uniref:hypothetical protein n=1 Tax=Nocardia sp. NPDC059180 TaxID=3346761 RepID=UPI0036A98090
MPDCRDDTPDHNYTRDSLISEFEALSRGYAALGSPREANLPLALAGILAGNTNYQAALGMFATEVGSGFTARLLAAVAHRYRDTPFAGELIDGLADMITTAATDYQRVPDHIPEDWV